MNNKKIKPLVCNYDSKTTTQYRSSEQLFSFIKKQNKFSLVPYLLCY